MANEELTCVGIGLMSAICSTAALFFLMKLRSMKVGLESKSKPQTKDSNGSKKGWLDWFKEKFQSFKDSAKTAASYVAAPFQKSEVEPEDGNWILMDVSQISSDQEDFKSRVLTEGQKLDLKTVSKNEIIYIPKDQENCLSQSSSLLNQCHHADCLRKEKLEKASATNKKKRERKAKSTAKSEDSSSSGWIEKFKKAKHKVKQKYKEEKRKAKEFLRKKFASSSSDEIEAKVTVEKNQDDSDKSKSLRSAASFPDDSDNFDVNVDIQVNEKHPVQIHVDAQIEDNAMDVHGSANTAEGTGEVKIEATLDDGNGSKANDEIELSVDSKNSDSDSMHLETK